MTTNETPPSQHEVKEEHPGPSARALRTMAVVRWVLLALVTALAGYTVWSFWGPKENHTHEAQGEARYYCPMHPQIRSPEPGECPICFMKLEPIPIERQVTATAAPTVPGAVSPTPGVTTVTLSEEKQRAVGLATSVVESGSLGDRLRVPGVISAPETGLAQVRVRAPGFVEQVVVRQTGAQVKRGQPLAYIYSPDIYRAQEELIAASRWQGVGGDPSTSGGTDIVSAGRRGLELLGLASAEIDEIIRTGQPKRTIPVRATASGFVTRFNAILGSRADPEMVLYEIADLSSVWVIASVHERDVASLKVGATARFTQSGTEGVLTGRVDLIEPMLEESTRTTRVRVSFPNRDGSLRPGQFGEVEFDLPVSDGLFVPNDAVIRTGEHEYVYVATAPDRFEPRAVRTGITREGRVQILSGVAAGDRIVTRGSFMLDSESRLQASLAAVAAPAPAASAQGGAAAKP